VPITIIKGKPFSDEKVTDALLHLSAALFVMYGKNSRCRHALLDEMSDAIRNGARFCPSPRLRESGQGF